MQLELDAIRKRLHTLIMVREVAGNYRLDEMNHLRLREKLTVWKINNGFDRIEVQDERQHRGQGHVCPVDDPNHCQTDVFFYPRRPPTT